MRHNEHCVAACESCFPLGRGYFYVLNRGFYKGVKIWLPYKKVSIPAWIPDWKPKEIHGTYSFKEVCNKDPYIYFEPGARGVFAWVRGTNMEEGGGGDNQGEHLGAFISTHVTKKRILKSFLWVERKRLKAELKQTEEDIKVAEDYIKEFHENDGELPKLKTAASKLRIKIKNIM